MSFKTSNSFPFLKIFEENHLKILNEFQKITSDMLEWPQKELYNDGWEAFGIFDWPSGAELASAERCPFTRDLIKKYIPNHGAAGFSRLKAGTVLTPHEGLDANFLRMHLGLMVPIGDCGIRSLNISTTWEEGRAFVFDDRNLHEAWNKTNEDRVILLIDFVP